MGRFAFKIDKLIQALELEGIVYLLDRRQQWSDKLNKKVQAITLSESIPTDEYNKDNPKPKNTDKSRVKVAIFTTFSEVEVIKFLAGKYRQVTRNGRKIRNTC